MREENKKCICENCKDCNWFRYKEMERVENGKPTGVKEMKQVCLFEFYFDALHFVMGSIDGLQAGINEARNRSMEAKATTEEFGDSVLRIVQSIGLKLIKERRSNVFRVSEAKTVGKG